MASGTFATGARTISQAEGGDLAEVGADYEDLRRQTGELIALILAAPPTEPTDKS
jgi:hypothetical protein